MTIVTTIKNIISYKTDSIVQRIAADEDIFDAAIQARRSLAIKQLVSYF